VISMVISEEVINDMLLIETDNHITKPFTPAKIKKKLAQLIT
jgi:hypothetical protein